MLFRSGDFNDLNTSEITNLHPLEQIVNFPTRENNTLDLILTDIEEYKSAGCVKEAPILTNDHCAIATPSANCIPKPKYQTIKKRIITQSAKIALTQELSSITWNEMYTLESADEKVNYLHSTVNKIYDKHCPIKTFVLQSTSRIYHLLLQESYNELKEQLITITIYVGNFCQNK